MRTTLILLTGLLFQINSQAQMVDETYVIQAALDVRNDFVQALQKKDFTEFAERGMDAAIGFLSDDIRTQYKDQQMADELVNTWKAEAVDFEARLMFAATLTDLGDHAPLIPALDQFFGKMSEKYGRVILNLPLVQDIRMMNYALPVVFQPRGVWQNKDIDNRIEYRKHFIPFANFVTYYAVLFTCNYLVKKNGQEQLKRLCKPSAEKLKFAMGRYVAPPVSDWIFNLANKNLNRDIRITDRQLRYTSADQLRAAIKE